MRLRPWLVGEVELGLDEGMEIGIALFPPESGYQKGVRRDGSMARLSPGGEIMANLNRVLGIYLRFGCRFFPIEDEYYTSTQIVGKSPGDYHPHLLYHNLIKTRSHTPSQSVRYYRR